jgi:ribosomal protein S6--L-glutamate ligase
VKQCRENLEPIFTWAASIIKPTAEEKRIAIAAKAMDLKVAGVDIIRSSKGPLLLEVNSSQG